MINFKDRELVGPSVVSLVALVVMAGTALGLILIPKPTNAKVKAESKKKEMKALIASEDARRKLDDANLVISTTAWTGAQDEVGPTALARVTAMAKKRNLNLTAFRPQRVNDDPGLMSLPFLISVDGPYVNVVQFTKDLETSGTRLAVNMVQIASADATNDRVTANIGVTAFVKQSPTKPDEKVKATEKGTSGGTERA